MKFLEIFQTHIHSIIINFDVKHQIILFEIKNNTNIHYHIGNFDAFEHQIILINSINIRHIILYNYYYINIIINTF